MRGRAAWRALACALWLFSCGHAPPAPESVATATPSNVAASAQARALVEASLTRRAVRTLPSFTKMALVKLLPELAPKIADDVDAVLDEDAYFEDVARRIDAALSPNESAALVEAMREPAVAFVLSQLIGEASPGHRPQEGGATQESREHLFEAAMPPGRGTEIARLPLQLAGRIGRAALAPDDARQPDLARFLDALPVLPRLEERDAFVRALSAATPDEVARTSACFLEGGEVSGPCARAHDVLHQAHLAAAEQHAQSLELRLKQRVRTTATAASGRG